MTGAALPKRTGRPLEADRHGEAGGKNAIPRSLGLTLEVLRGRRTRAEMLTLLLAYSEEQSPYGIRTYKTNNKKTMDAAVGNWESALHEPQFGIQHRYGLASDTWSGVLHLISLFCADLRDAAVEADRQRKLTNITLVADRLVALAERAKALAVDYEQLDFLRELGGDITDTVVRERHKEVIRDLLAAYHSVRRDDDSR